MLGFIIKGNKLDKKTAFYFTNVSVHHYSLLLFKSFIKIHSKYRLYIVTLALAFDYESFSLRDTWSQLTHLTIQKTLKTETLK